MKKKKISSILKVMLFVIGIVGICFGKPGNVKAADTPTIPAPSDIPQVYITTSTDYIDKKDTLHTKLILGDYVDAAITVIDKENGTCTKIEEPKGKIKVRGNSTATLDKQPYNIKFDKKQEVLGMSAGKKWCLLANHFDRSLMRNKLAYDFAKDIELLYSPETRYVDVWLNGKLLGNYLMSVPIDTDKNRVDIDVTKHEYLLEICKDYSRDEDDTFPINTRYFRFGINAPSNFDKSTYESDERVVYLKNFLEKAEKAMESNDFNEIQKYIDVESFSKFYIVEEVFKNLDVNGSSTRFYIKGDKLFAGPLWDVDLSAGNVSQSMPYDNYKDYNNIIVKDSEGKEKKFGNGSGNSYEGEWAFNGAWAGATAEDTYGGWMRMLMKCTSFKNTVRQTYLNLNPKIKSLYDKNDTNNKIDSLYNNDKASFLRNFSEVSKGGAGWKITPISLDRIPDATFEENVEYLRNWLQSRDNWLQKDLNIDTCKDGKIYSSVTFCDSDGKVLSTQTVAFGEKASAPLGLTKTGFTFTGWDRSDSNIKEDMKITAVYKKNSYTVKFCDSNGRVLSKQEVLYEEGATAPESPSKDGYVFDGWDKDFSKVTENITVTAKYKEVQTSVGLTSATLSADEFILYLTGDKKSTTLSIKADGSYQTVNWSSSNRKIATVKDGVVTAVKTGTVTITADLGNGVTAKCTVKVKKAVIKDLKSKVTLKKGKTYKCKPTIEPGGKITFKVNDKKIATVNAKGMVKAKKAGKVKLTIFANGISKTISITVK